MLSSVASLTIGSAIILLIISLWGLRHWRLSDDEPGDHAALFCTSLLMGAHAIALLLGQVVNIEDVNIEGTHVWLEQLAWYAGVPLLSFVLMAKVFYIDWPKEAWGRILLGVCGVYWLAQNTQLLSAWLLLSASLGVISSAVLLNRAHQHHHPHPDTPFCIKQKILAAVAGVMSLIGCFVSVFYAPDLTNVALVGWFASIARSLVIIDAQSQD